MLTPMEELSVEAVIVTAELLKDEHYEDAATFRKAFVNTLYACCKEQSDALHVAALRAVRRWFGARYARGARTTAAMLVDYVKHWAEARGFEEIIDAEEAEWLIEHKLLRAAT
jgi:hypothetical protein